MNVFLRLECVNHKSNKFWEVAILSDGTYIRRWGGIGKSGLQKEIDQADILDLKDEKLRKGYEIVIDDGMPVGKNKIEKKPITKEPKEAKEEQSFFDIIQKV